MDTAILYNWNRGFYDSVINGYIFQQSIIKWNCECYRSSGAKPYCCSFNAYSINSG